MKDKELVLLSRGQANWILESLYDELSNLYIGELPEFLTTADFLRFF